MMKVWTLMILVSTSRSRRLSSTMTLHGARKSKTITRVTLIPMRVPRMRKISQRRPFVSKVSVRRSSPSNSLLLKSQKKRMPLTLMLALASKPMIVKKTPTPMLKVTISSATSFSTLMMAVPQKKARKLLS